MKYDAIMFDLDGTLLPMDNDEFLKGYCGLLYGAAKPYGYEQKSFLKALWQGVGAMVKNDGTCKNSDAFWKYMAENIGEQVYNHIEVFDNFYDGDFHKAKVFTQPNPLAREAVNLARTKANKVILATNPLFPEVGVRSRLSWLDLTIEDFDYVTNYDNSCFCKPNPAYYQDILKKYDLNAENCLMIGNNAQEDIEAAGACNMDTFLVTDNLINEGEIPDCKQGSFQDLIDFLKAL